MKIQPTISSPLDPTEEDMLDEYLKLSKQQRQDRFMGTASAAEFTGLSIRTIQSWIESGRVRAFALGKKYQLDVTSLKEYLKNLANGSGH